jgi:threonine/homoserine/homoserine lactone efflux protein
MQGIVIGLTLAVPVGPIALLCIQRTITDGRLHGIVSGLGVATADAFYAAITFLGLTFISGLIITHQSVFRILAGFIFILIGIRVYLTVPEAISTRAEHETYLKDYLSMVTIAFANPLTLIFFIAILPGFGVIVQGTELFSAAEFVAGLFSGSMAWWIFLCGTIGSFRSRISPEHLRVINRISGLMILCFGAGMLAIVFFLSPHLFNP